MNARKDASRERRIRITPHNTNAPDISDEALMRIHITVRKTAHFVEYGILALLAARAFLSSSHIFLRRRWLVLSFLLVACASLLDEYHQSFETSRTGTIYDSLVDMAGGTVALALLMLWRSHRLKKKSGQLSG